MNTRFVPYPTTDYDIARVTSDEPDPKAGGAAHRYEFWHGDVSVGVLQFQHGPRNTAGSEAGPFQMQVIAALLDQFRGFQAGPFASAETAGVVTHLEAVLAILQKRRDDRHARGALGKATA